MYKKIIPFLFLFLFTFSSVPVSAYGIAEEEQIIQTVNQRGYTVPGISASTTELTGLKYRHPEIFWTGMIWQRDADTVCISYPTNTTQEKVEQMQKKLNRKVKKIKKSIPKTLNKTKKVLAIFDYVATHTTYTLEGENVATAYGALVEGHALCDGYTKAVALLLNEFGIKNGVMVSEKANHAWNVVCIGGKWYHLDATWGDMERYGIDHDYFLVTERKLFRLDKNRKDMVYYGHFGVSYKPAKKSKSGFWKRSPESYYKKIKK